MLGCLYKWGLIVSTQSHRSPAIHNYYPSRTHRWHAETFSDYFGVELIVDDRLRPGADFALTDDRSTVYLPSWLSPLGFHHRLMEVGVTLGCGPDAIPDLIKVAKPFLAAAYGKLIGPARYV